MAMPENRLGAPIQRPVLHEVSAGGVVVRCTADGMIEVALCGRASPTIWSLPKGTPEGSESREETALREVQEETGLAVAMLRPLGDVRYTFERDGALHNKRVFHFLLEPNGGHLEDHDSEFDVVEWFPLDSATLDMMTYDTDVEILERAIRTLGAAEDTDHGDSH